jgi:hypothetical protein
LAFASDEVRKKLQQLEIACKKQNQLRCLFFLTMKKQNYTQLAKSATYRKWTCKGLDKAFQLNGLKLNVLKNQQLLR